MKAIILAGGYGTRLSEETTNKPKPIEKIRSSKIYFVACCLRQNFVELLIPWGPVFPLWRTVDMSRVAQVSSKQLAVRARLRTL